MLGQRVKKSSKTYPQKKKWKVQNWNSVKVQLYIRLCRHFVKVCMNVYMYVCMYSNMMTYAHTYTGSLRLIAQGVGGVYNISLCIIWTSYSCVLQMDAQTLWSREWPVSNCCCVEGDEREKKQKQKQKGLITTLVCLLWILLVGRLYF